ncbi:MAG: HEAT repeat domain-containing protein [Rhodothermales bacterium]|nr:HEAT repeat domain-containing protein [Rhodothermales bacterium]MBO6781594.1 HEAT repeat domain-containing protein [Rhodothermales bacterium]
MRRLLIAFLLLSPGMVRAQQVVQPPATAETFEDRLSWALAQRGEATILWTVDSQAMMSSWSENDPPLREVLGLSDGDPAQAAIMLRLEGGSVVHIRTQRLDSPAVERRPEERRRPIRWLGAATQSESFAALSGLSVSGRAIRGRLYAYGILSDVPAAGRVVSDALVSSESVDLRKAAAYALGRHSGNDAIERLKRASLEDPSVDVSKAAGYAIGAVNTPEALTALQDLIARHTSREIRKAAVYAVGNLDLPEARMYLLELARTEQ